MKRFGQGLAVTVAAVAVFVRLGWFAGWETLTAPGPDFAAMQPTTALGLFLLAVAALGRSRALSAGCAGAGVALGVLTYAGFVLDRPFAPAEHLPWWGGPDPDPMSGATALALSLLGLATIAAQCGRRAPFHLLLAGAFVIAQLGLLGYIYGARSLYAVSGFHTMAVHTTLCVLAVAVALAIRFPAGGLVEALTDRGPAGTMTRRLFPLLLVGPPALGGLERWGHHQGWFDDLFGEVILVTGLVCAGLGLTWWAASWLRRVDHDREQARAALLEANRHLEEAVGDRTAELTRTAQRLGALVQLAPVGIVECAPDGAVLRVNEQWMALTGLTQEEARGDGWRRAMHPDDLERVSQEWAVSAAERSLYESSCRMLTRSGRVIWVQIHAQPLVEGDEVVGHLAIVTDVTALQMAQERFRSMLDSAPDAILGIAATGRIQLVNAQTERVFGYDREDLVGKPLEVLIPERLRGEHPVHRRAYFDDPQPRPMGGGLNLAAVRQDGSEFPVEVSLSSMQGEDGQLVIAAVRDVSDREETQRMLAHARDVAESAARSRQDFLANMSHEIRTPMNAVIGMTSLLLDTELDERQHDFVATLRTSGEHLLAIINDILDYAKIDSGKMQLEELPFGLRAWLTQSLELVATQARDKGLELVYDVAPEVPEAVVGDQARLRQILINLLSNAVKFTPVGHIVVRATVDSAGERPRLRIAVEDTGVGVAPERIEQLFEPFTQADGTTTRVYGGTGLGLAISRRLAEEMGGQLHMTSEPGAGTTVAFTFTVDVQQVQHSTTEPLPELAGKRLLVVDGDGVRRRDIQIWAQRLGMSTVGADSLLAAMQASAEHPPDLAIVDMATEGSDSLRLGRLLRQRNPHTRLALLAWPGAAPAMATVDQGFDVVLPKPLGHDRFVAGMAEALGLRPHGWSPASAETTGPLPIAAISAQPARSVLVVEDVPVNQKVARHLLDRLGCRTDVAASGREAIEVLEQRDYDLVLMDIQMPEMDGLEATRIIRTRWPEREIRIVAMTANVGADDTARCYAAGMNGFLPKPISLETLDAVLAESPARGGGPRSETPAADEQEPASEAAINRAAVRALAEQIGPEAARQIAEVFLESFSTALSDLEACCRERDRQRLAAAAHSFKGAARSMGAERLGDLLQDLERDAAQAEWPELEGLTARIHAQRAPTHDELSAELIGAGSDEGEDWPRLSQGA